MKPSIDIVKLSRKLRKPCSEETVVAALLRVIEANAAFLDAMAIFFNDSPKFAARSKAMKDTAAVNRNFTQMIKEKQNGLLQH